MKINHFCLRRPCGSYPTYSKRLTLATLMRIFRSFIPALAILVLYNNLCFAQNANTYDRRGIFAELGFGLGEPIGQLSDRFGFHQSAGLGLGYHPSHGIEWGFRYQFIFGKDVREDVLAPYRTDLGQLIGVDNFLTDVLLRERMTAAYAYAGWLWPLGSQQRYRHGLKFNTGAGFMEHHIRIQDDARAAIQFSGDFGRGLDRLANGFCLQCLVGYELKSRNGKVNLYTGVEILYGFTQARRIWNYDTANSDLGIGRQDIILQWKLGWYLPFFIDRHAESLEY